MPTPLADQADAFLSVLGQFQTAANADVASFWQWIQTHQTFQGGQWTPVEMNEMLAQLKKNGLVDIVQGHVAMMSDTTAAWYDDLDQGSDFVAEPAPAAEIVPEKRILESASWAVHSAQTAETALSQLQGTIQRMVADGQRETVTRNAAKEKVKYARHTNYAGACNFCLTLATKGAVFASATSAIQSHDNCKCIAVPVRGGQTYEPPQMVKDAEVKYAKASEALKAEGKPVTLQSVTKKMDELDAKNAAGAEKAKVEEWLGAEKAFKKKESKAKAAKKFAEKKKAEKAQATTDWLAAEQKYKDDASAWLVAEAQFTAQAAKLDAKKAAKAAANKKWAEKKKAEKLAQQVAAGQADEPFTAPKAVPIGKAPAVGQLTYVKPAGGSHGAAIYNDPTDGQWVVKPQKHYKNLLDKATADLQKKTGLHAPDVFTVDIPGVGEASAQTFFTGGNAFSQQIITKGALKGDDLLVLQKQEVLDWLIANHDTHAQQFVRDQSGTLVGIDKGQAFKWYGKDKLDWDFHPNKPTGEHEPIYNTIWKMAVAGDVNPHNPGDPGPLRDYIQGVMAIPDAELKDMLRPFAEAAAKQGNLVSKDDGHGLLKAKIPPNDVEAFLDLVVARKNNLQNDFDTLYAKYASQAGKPVPTAPTPPPIPQPPVPPVDALVATHAQASQLADFIATAHKAAKLGDDEEASKWLEMVEFNNNMTVQAWAAKYPHLVKHYASKKPVAPAAKALQAYQHQKAMELIDQYNAGNVDAGKLAQPGHVAGIKAQQYNIAAAYTPSDFAKDYPSKVKLEVEGADDLDKFFEAFDEPQKPPAAAVAKDYNAFAADAAWNQLNPTEQFKVGKAKAAAKHAAKKKGDLAAVAQIDALTKAEYYAMKQGILPSDWKAGGGAGPELKGVPKAQPVTAPPPAPAPPPPVFPPSVGHLGGDFDVLPADVKKKAGKQLAAAKFAVKNKTTTEGKLEWWIYDQWSPKDWYAAKALKTSPGSNPVSDTVTWTKEKLTQLQAQEYDLAKNAHTAWVKQHPTSNEIDSPYWAPQQKLKWATADEYQGWLLDHGQTSMLGSPLDPTPKLPGGKLPGEKPPPNPPTDPAKIAQVQQMEAAYKAAKPGGTGFNPVKGINPTGSLKANIDDFDAQIGVGYLTDDQLTQVLIKLPNSYQTKYLKKYADAKGQSAADAIAAKVKPSGPQVAAPKTSAGSKPSIHYGSNWKQTVTIKPGTSHTPVRSQAPASSIQNLNGAKGLVVTDPNAELGSSANPHVFSIAESDQKVFGSLITDQDQANWVAAQYKKIKSYTSSGYHADNEKLRVDLAAMLDKWDEAAGKWKINPDTGKPYEAPKLPASLKSFDQAFESATTKTNEEWMVLTRGTSRREFNDNDVPGLDPFQFGGNKGTVAELKQLEGHTYIQRGIGSTSISDKPAFSGKHIRVIYRVPPGTKMIYVDGDPGYNALTSCSGEREVLLPRNTRCKVLEVRESTGSGSAKLDVVVEIVGQETWP